MSETPIKMPDYRKTKLACYFGFIVQAIAANFAPLLFLKFRKEYRISLGNIALISTVYFFMQLLIDLFCAKFVDRIGYRISIVVSEVCSATGLIEVLASPIIEACPFENKEATREIPKVRNDQQ